MFMMSELQRTVTVSFVILVLLVLQGNCSYIRAPSIFRGDEADMHKYSAVLAATEPHQIACHNSILNSVGPLKRLALWVKGGPLLQQANTLRDTDDDIDDALSNYEDKVTKALNAYGMEAEEFNEISRLVSQDPSLKQKVNLQAYYYKIAGDLQANIKPGSAELPHIPQQSLFSRFSSLLTSTSTVSSVRTEKKKNTDLSIPNTTPLQRFVRTIALIEKERLNIRHNLMEELNISELPDKISEPSLQSAYTNKIQTANYHYPHIVYDIINREGLTVQEFNHMLEKTNKNILFSMRVYKELHKLPKS